MLDTPCSIVTNIDAGEPVVTLAGIHGGCFELFGTDRVRSIRDLKGKTVGLLVGGCPERILVSAMAAYVGPDPGGHQLGGSSRSRRSIAAPGRGQAGRLHGLPSGAAGAQGEARSVGSSSTRRRIGPGRSISAAWRSGAASSSRKYPVATKRFLRAILKATDLCAREPDRVARYPSTRATRRISSTPTETAPECHIHEVADGQIPRRPLRFYALRLRDGGMIKATPQKIIAQGTDWRFLNELKKELKG